MNDPIKVMIVDDQSLFREALITLLSTKNDFVIVAEAGNGEDAVRIAAEKSPDVILMDLRMPVMDGVEATKLITKNSPATHIIILTTFDDNDDVIDALRAGAVGYLMKDVSSAKLFEAIQSTHKGEYFLLPSITAKVVNELSRTGPFEGPSETGITSDFVESLSNREMEILQLVAIGNSNKEIAEKLVITEGTVKNHLSSILAKLSARDRTQAVARARELRILK